MKRIYINIILIGVLVFISTGCSDFFETDNDTQLRGDDYVKEVGELYSGFWVSSLRCNLLAIRLFI